MPGFRDDNPAFGGQSVVDLYVSVAVLLSMIMATIQTMPSVLSSYRERGALRRMRATPVRPESLLLAQGVMHGAAIVLSTVLVLAVGRIGLGTPLPRQLGSYAVAFGLVLLAALAIGSTITALSPTARVTTIVGSIVFFPMMFTAGVWVPVQAMPELVQQIVLLTPFGAGAVALNAATVGNWPSTANLLVMAGWAAGLGYLAVRNFRWE